jgi:hypothetical protein
MSRRFDLEGGVSDNEYDRYDEKLRKSQRHSRTSWDGHDRNRLNDEDICGDECCVCGSAQDEESEPAPTWYWALEVLFSFLTCAGIILYLHFIFVGF